MRHSLGELRVPTDFGTNISGKSSGQLPGDLSRDYCRQKGVDQLLSGVAKTRHWTESEFHRVFQKYETKFDDAFFASHEYINYFQGKDIAKALTRAFQNKPLNLEDYYDYAMGRFDYTKFQDLKQLRELVSIKLS